ncbi:hypothetical protein [Actinophytocola sediminis]
MDASTLACRLGELRGWEALMRGMFGPGRAKRSYAIYASARRRGVYVNHELRFVVHESLGYAVMAFALTGALAGSVREVLAAQADHFALGAVRRAGVAYNNLLPIAGPHPIHAIADPFPGVRVYVATTSPKGADRPFVVHADQDGTDHIFPVPGERLR